MKLKLSHHETEIKVGKGVLKHLIPYLKKKQVTKVVLIADARLKEAQKKVSKLFASHSIELGTISVKAGEDLKDFKTLYPLYADLLGLKADRDTVIIALGGGSIGDAIGFIASTYLRGVRWIGLPTTLLAQVDSSIGGKTGLNHEAGKNLIGTFHQPSLVLCETDFLMTLSKREIASGIGEIVKYAITFDAKFFSYLDKNLDRLLKLDPQVTQKSIETSLQFKVDAVEEDERDRLGIREVLNFGHTFGHALETLTGYERYQHGEGVVWGMRFAVALSEIRGHLDPKIAAQITQLLIRIPVPPLPANLNLKSILSTLKKDKKSSRNQVRFVLIRKIGKSVSDRGVSETDLAKAFERIQA